MHLSIKLHFLLLLYNLINIQPGSHFYLKFQKFIDPLCLNFYNPKLYIEVIPSYTNL